MLDRAQETKRDLSPDELTKNQTNIIFTSDKGLLPQLIAKLRLQNISFLSIFGPASLPGDTKVKNLFYFFGLTVPEALQKIAGKYVYTLEPNQKGKVLSEITRSLKADVIIFDNFLAGLSDEIIHYFAGILKSLKENCTIVYFTNSLMVTTVICDPVNDHIHKWTKEQIAF
jgi:ABC-type Na+ transport system ATPase subunit NatA